MGFAEWSVVACVVQAILCSTDADKSTCSALLNASSELSGLKALHISSEFNDRLNAERVLNRKDLKKTYTGGTLYIQRDYMSSRDMEGVGNLENLTDLSISCKIEPGSLFHLQKLERLKTLKISCSNKLSSEDFCNVKNIKGLQSLDISTCYCVGDRTYRSQYSYASSASMCTIL